MDKKHRIDKKGSYIFETAMLLPFLFIAAVALSSLIPAFCAFENSVYSSCDEMRESSIRQATAKYDVCFSIRLEKRMDEELSKDVNFDIVKFRQGVRKYGSDDVMMLEYVVTTDFNNPVGIADNVEFDGKVMARAFTGRKEKGNPFTEEEFTKNCDSEKVYIFPKSGRKYHKEGCRYIRPACKAICLTGKIRKKWDTCSICKSEKANTGEMVFCFPDSGKVYHRSECSNVKKYYIEMEKFFAEKKGYMPCQVCF